MTIARFVLIEAVLVLVFAAVALAAARIIRRRDRSGPDR